jgi:hypothetical protein
VFAGQNRSLPSLFILHTVETRWFTRGVVPADIPAWFAALPGDAEDQPLRRDLYLQPVADGGLSVKLREGGLEIKQRQETLGRFRFGPSATGLVERWTKWRFPLDETFNHWQSILDGGRSWQNVDKKRWLKHYRLDETGAIQVMPYQLLVQETGSQAFHLELANLRVGDQRWWTIAYEVAASEQPVSESLRSIAAQHLSEWQPGQLSISNSCGYPQWLAARVQSIDNYPRK